MVQIAVPCADFYLQHLCVLARGLRRFCLLLLWSKSVRKCIQSDLCALEALALLPKHLGFYIAIAFGLLNRVDPQMPPSNYYLSMITCTFELRKSPDQFHIK